MTNETVAPPTMDAVARLLAIEEIRALHARYWRFVDTKNWDAFGALFAPDASFTEHLTGFHCEGSQEIQAQVAAFLDGATTVHHGHQSEIAVHDESSAEAIFVMEDYLIFPPGTVNPGSGAPMSTLRGYGHYVEKLTKIDEQWRFQQVDLYRVRVETVGSAATAFPPALLRD
jgi:uncharacterized protein (TIGR02246 family)